MSPGVTNGSGFDGLAGLQSVWHPSRLPGFSVNGVTRSCPRIHKMVFFLQEYSQERLTMPSLKTLSNSCFTTVEGGRNRTLCSWWTTHPSNVVSGSSRCVLKQVLSLCTYRRIRLSSNRSKSSLPNWKPLSSGIGGCTRNTLNKLSMFSWNGALMWWEAEHRMQDITLGMLDGPLMSPRLRLVYYHTFSVQFKSIDGRNIILS